MDNNDRSVTLTGDLHYPEKTWSEETGKRDPPRVLLTSVFGPYAKDEGYGQKHTFSMELYNNQITRAQGPYSLRMFHNSWGIRMIQANISAPSTVLDFPSLEAFEKELRSHNYDIVGITSIIMNVKKVRLLCDIIRKLSPNSKIVVGGHIAAIPDLGKIIEADHIVKGDGISWMRRYLGEDDKAPIIHPPLLGTFGFRVMGVTLPETQRSPDATIVSSVGCPMGCKFCATSNFFGGKGKSVVFLKTGAEIYQAMCEAESSLKTGDFFVMDENFLLNRKRVMELLELMKANNKSWSLNVFASANAIRQYTMGELVELGISMLWIGLESPRSQFEKLKSADTMKLVEELQSNGIKVIGSTIIGLEHHTPENVIEEIEYAVRHDSDFHQFMLYIPFFGTPLYAELEKEGRLLKDMDHTEFPGLHAFSFKHATISREESERLINWAFQHDFERNGPSFYRLLRTTFRGWMKHKNHPDLRVRKRIERVATPLRTVATAFFWAMERIYKDRDPAMGGQIRSFRLEVEKEFGLLPCLSARLLGPVLVWTTRREEERLARGITYEPRTFIERKNWL